MPTKILAIDDSKTMRLAIKITFAAEDADVTSVSKGSEAVARAKQMGADVVLVDAMLAAGEPSGYDVCRALKQDPATANIPVIVLVSNQTGVDQAKLGASGADEWLAKPFDTQELIDKVAAVRSKAGASPSITKVVTGPVAAVPPPRAAAEAEASQSGSGRRRPENRTQTGMPSPVAAAPTTRPAAASGPAVAARAPLGKPSISAASLAAKPATPATPATPVAPPPTQAVAPAPRPAKAKPVAAAPTPRVTPAASGLARPAGGAAIPIAIPIPFTAAEAPTAGMVERLRQAASAGNVDPKVAEAIAALSREVLETIAWEIVPDLAETIIRERMKSSA